jgi:hypothetical protein
MAKEPTPKQLEARRKFGEAARERAAARRAEKQNKNPENQKEIITETFNEKTPEQVDVPVAPQTQADGSPVVTIGRDEYEDLLRQIKEVQQMPWQLIAQMQQGQPQAAVAHGKLTGTTEKFPELAQRIADAGYPDPTERLSNEPKLARFAFPINYELNFIVDESSYTTIDNVRMREPKFTLELVRRMLDEENGEDTGGRYVVCQLIFHEDPDTALVVAKANGVDINPQDEAMFLNEMRYIRMRDWLLECFYPPQISTSRQKRQMVIEGKLVDYYEVNTEGASGIRKTDWDNIPRIKF